MILQETDYEILEMYESGISPQSIASFLAEDIEDVLEVIEFCVS